MSDVIHATNHETGRNATLSESVTSGNAPKVSLLLPIYNVEAYLRDCIESIVHQSLKEIEIILLDDGSTDRSSQICDEFAQRDDRIRVIHKKNSGYGATLNVGLDAAKGKYIAIVETDDYVLPTMYETLCDVATEQNADVVKCNFRRFYGEGNDRIFEEVVVSPQRELYYRVINALQTPDLFKVYNVIWNGIYRRDFIEKNHIRFNETPGASFQDNGFWFQTTVLAKRTYMITQPFYMLRRDNPNSSVRSSAKVYCMCDEYEFIGEFVKKHPEFPMFITKWFWKKRYGNYLWTLNRITEEFKINFLERFSGDFREALQTGLISAPEFSKKEIQEIQKIVNDPVAYYQGQKQGVQPKKRKFRIKAYILFFYYLWMRARLRKRHAMRQKTK